MTLEELQQMVKEYTEINYKTLHNKSKGEIQELYIRVNDTKCRLEVYECLIHSSLRQASEELKSHILTHSLITQARLDDYNEIKANYVLTKDLILILTNLEKYLEDNF